VVNSFNIPERVLSILKSILSFKEFSCGIIFSFSSVDSFFVEGLINRVEETALG
jgi:hypothetical protein